MKTIVLLGKIFQLYELTKAQLKGISIGESLSYRFFEGKVNDISMLFLEPKKKADTPRSLAITSERFSLLFQKSVVYILPSCPAFERQRLIDKNVFFIVSDKFAYLPNLMVLERMKMTKPAQRLTPVAQYLLLYHLQIENINEMTARDLEGHIPYSYASITLGITCLEEVGLLNKTMIGGKSNVIRFELSAKELWEGAKAYLINPVNDIIYCDNFESDTAYPICGINALSHYTMLNPDPEKRIVFTKKQWKEIKASDVLICPNKYDGNIKIEVWKYPPVGIKGSDLDYVDRLSLALSLREDQDPRVEGEVQQLIKETEWKD